MTFARGTRQSYRDLDKYNPEIDIFGHSMDNASYCIMNLFKPALGFTPVTVFVVTFRRSPRECVGLDSANKPPRLIQITLRSRSCTTLAIGRVTPRGILLTVD